MSEWSEATLAEIALINPPETLRQGTIAKKVGMSELQPFTKRISGYVMELYKGGSKFRNGDTLLARITPCLENGKTAQVDILGDGEIGFGSTEFIVLREKDGESDKDFIFYFTISPEFRNVAVLSMTGSSGRQRVQTDVIATFPFRLPVLSEQRAIAAVLSALDDKIDLLRRQNKTLEALAQTVFRHWFVEGAEDDWEVTPIGDVLTAVGGTTPSTKNPEYWDGDVHWTTPRDLSNNDGIYLLDTARKITERGLAQISSGLLPSGTLLLSSRAPVGYLAFAEVPLAVNQGYIAIIDDKVLSKTFMYLWLKENMDYVKSYAGGTTFQEISKSTFRSLEIAVPTQRLLVEFEQIAFPMFEKIRINAHQIAKLQELRDMLLPKLMSGEVRVR